MWTCGDYQNNGNIHCRSRGVFHHCKSSYEPMPSTAGHQACCRNQSGTLFACTSNILFLGKTAMGTLASSPAAWSQQTSSWPALCFSQPSYERLACRRSCRATNAMEEWREELKFRLCVSQGRGKSQHLRAERVLQALIMIKTLESHDSS